MIEHIQPRLQLDNDMRFCLTYKKKKIDLAIPEEVFHISFLFKFEKNARKFGATVQKFSRFLKCVRTKLNCKI